MQVTEQQHGLPRGCGVSSLGISSSRLDVALGTLLWVALLEEGPEQVGPDFPANLSHAVIVQLCGKSDCRSREEGLVPSLVCSRLPQWTVFPGKHDPGPCRALPDETAHAEKHFW